MWNNAVVKQDANDQLVFTATLHEDSVPMNYQATITGPTHARVIADEIEIEFCQTAEEALLEHPAIIWFNDGEHPLAEPVLLEEAGRLRAGWRLRFAAKDQAMLFKMMFVGTPAA